MLGALANLAKEYATKRYRSNCINWGMLPFHLKDDPDVLEVDDYIFIPDVHHHLEMVSDDITAYVIKNNEAKPIHLYLEALTPEEKQIIKAGCLINYNRNR